MNPPTTVAAGDRYLTRGGKGSKRCTWYACNWGACADIEGWANAPEDHIIKAEPASNAAAVRGFPLILISSVGIHLKQQ